MAGKFVADEASLEEYPAESFVNQQVEALATAVDAARPEVMGSEFSNVGIPGQRPTPSMTQVEGSRFPRFTQERYDELNPSFGGEESAWALRAGLGRQETAEEKALWLDRTVGKGQWTQDNRGQFALRPEAAARYGVHSDKPVLIDEPGLSWHDFADLQGDAPEIAGATVGGALGAARGIPGGPFGIGFNAILGAYLGAVGGSSGQETYEELVGENLQEFPEVMSDINRRGLYSGAGEALAKPVMAAGRYLLAPRGRNVSPEAMIAAEEVRSYGGQMRPGAMTERAGLLGRFEALSATVLGDTIAVQNNRAFMKALDDLKDLGGRRNITPSAAGAAAKQTIRRSRKALSRWATISYGKINDIAQGAAIIPMDKFKAAAHNIEGGWTYKVNPDGSKGNPIGVLPELKQLVEGITEAPDLLTVKQVQNWKAMLSGHLEEGTLIPGLGNTEAKNLLRAIQDGTNSVGGEVGDLLRAVNKKYGEKIKLFDDALVQRIARAPKFADYVPDEQVVSAIFKPKNKESVLKVMSFLKPKKREMIRRQAMEEILASALKHSSTSFRQAWDSVALKNKLDEYGVETLEAMFGKELSAEMHKFSRALHASTLTPGLSGGIVAANIALHPLQNLGHLAKLKILSKFLTTEQGFKWSTVGLRKEAEGLGIPQGLSAALRASIHSVRNQFGDLFSKDEVIESGQAREGTPLGFAGATQPGTGSWQFIPDQQGQ